MTDKELAQKPTLIPQLDYLRWHVRAIIPRYLQTCHATKESAQREVDEILKRKPYLKSDVYPAQTRCALRPLSADCFNHLPPALKQLIPKQALEEESASEEKREG